MRATLPWLGHSSTILKRHFLWSMAAAIRRCGASHSAMAANCRQLPCSPPTAGPARCSVSEAGSSACSAPMPAATCLPSNAMQTAVSCWRLLRRRQAHRLPRRRHHRPTLVVTAVVAVVLSMAVSWPSLAQLSCLDVDVGGRAGWHTRTKSLFITLVAGSRQCSDPACRLGSARFTFAAWTLRRHPSRGWRLRRYTNVRRRQPAGRLARSDTLLE